MLDVAVEEKGAAARKDLAVVSLAAFDTGFRLPESCNCKRVFTTHIGFVAEAVMMPAVAAEIKCTPALSLPLFNRRAYICFPLPYVKKLIDLYPSK